MSIRALLGLWLAAGLWAAGLAAAPDRGPDGLLAVPALERVSDPTGILSESDRTALDAKLAIFESRNGAQIGIVLVPSTRPEPIADFAHRVGDDWKLGRKEVGDGVLIVVAVRDRTARIDVARSLEGAIPDIVASRIIRENMAPHFAARDYAGGLNEAADKLFLLIAASEAPAPAAAPATPTPATPPPAPPPVPMAREPVPAAGLDQRLQAVAPFLIGGLIVGSLLRRLLGVLGAGLAAGGALAMVAWLFSSVALGLGVAAVVFLLSLTGVPLMIAGQVLGARGGGFSGGFGGGGGFRSGGGGDFAGGGASGNW